MTVDVATLTLGLFEPRVTDQGAPVAFAMEGMTFVVRRAGGDQRIDAGTRLGAAALIGDDGAVLGYGGMDLHHLDGIADAVDAAHGPAIGTPLQRLARHGYTLALPLDAMPDEVRDLFLAERLPDGVLETTRLNDETLDAVRACHERHERDEIEVGDDDANGRAEHDENVDIIVAVHGHAISTTSSNGPRRSYTIGLADVGWPELVSFLPDREALAAIDDVIVALRSRDQQPRAGMLITRTGGSTVELVAARPIASAIAPHAARRAQRRGSAPPDVVEVRIHRPGADAERSRGGGSLH